ncbi:similar to Saccharomyces cerevisiae YOL116W MSN1 Transcriptional activator involved in regulation of invertase and glucoamylase expression [Maudiozyma saulgeensis]|uniref:Similar to Saccharomyces cerevisiae YOL116W MSN1 Transcriptional activator involved in regulation of invertase and glucoamylase expression n=1 Tax=Maudiozyma saulgeensis TaxID=1789683 RepID=A0A1X7QZC4_9SACH|nr:similar to Saccharomyces cerevisiae YOL116W MSN1 Transcriptional activator involved in regulation of invertase and glucoamylase expression [Kazachstania saulgeensis]
MLSDGINNGHTNEQNEVSEVNGTFVAQQHNSGTNSNANDITSPTSHYINMLINETKLNSPSGDPRYLQLESSYTSGFHLRDEVDKFDFDHSLKNSMNATNNVSIDEVFGYSSSDEPTEDNDRHSGDDDDDVDVDMDGYESFDEPYGDIDDLLVTIDEVKGQVNQWIDNIDNTLSATPEYQQKDYRNGSHIPRVIKNNETTKLMNTITDIRDIVFEEDDNDDYYNPEDAKVQQLKQYGIVDIREANIRLKDPKVTNDPCSKLNNYGVVLMRWPESIAQLWDEYNKIPSEWSQDYLMSFLVNVRKINEMEHCNIDTELTLMRQSSIRELESKFSSGWRNEDKNFSRQINRRKKIWNAIEDGIADGIDVDDCIKVLTQYVEEENKGLSLYYKGVPFRIIDRLHKIK